MTASARDRLAAALARIDDPKGEGKRACLTVYRETSEIEADAADARAKAGISLGPLDGTIVSIKDLFDVRGEPTRAASKIYADAPPAKADAPVVQRLRAAGAVIVAKTAMSEFAFSGVGWNPHYGTPANPADRSRVPGGSSSGAAVAAADHMCEIAIGTDTGGSTRIPAALCGVVGFKPSKQRVPTDGAFPLSYTLDSIGPLARNVADCARADAVIAGEAAWDLKPQSVKGLRIRVPRSASFQPREDEVTKAFNDGLDILRKAGAIIEETPFPLLDEMIEANKTGGFPVPEALQIHRENLKTRGDDFDQNVRARIERGSAMSAADYIELMQTRSRLVPAMDAWMSGVDVLALPATPIVAPKIADIDKDTKAFVKANVALLSITSIFNFFDNCGISIPLPRPNGALPVGLMLIARNGRDRDLFRVAAGVERAFA
ncbi:biuret hydrolase [Variibacter gotjawalensis]|uniref:Biuret hydrolase n=1 Tax=Variibacter gotjawalensis TaxID=1333996 RepID=A0A0S3PUT3_9BRAD|nr:amidase [Variibacter gotjawalensis]NIK49977.1 aspartyl-tRNA(Asn)/glutamyl-tRNA(Gln) amidotransferase subunit A [Variibacter gotjawalensis]RZS45976.1 aspartyl-tRNA(Asn)/glutamyl-tRNA(Gln) amidotransferase subunit A [Variibacter gotjawalensis]BAT59651.1 biuret hydrolase [Variibacter gotjawalensis]